MDDPTAALQKAKDYRMAVLREWVESLIIAFFLAMVIRAFVLQAFRIPSGSMIPTLQIGDRLLVDKWTYGPKLPFTHDVRLPGIGEMKRGDVAVFIFPGDDKRDFIKRLIAFGGETVEIRNGDIYIDGERVAVPEIAKNYYYNRGDYGKAGEPVMVPEGHFFMLGDNSASSHDSRYWGFVPDENVVGRADMIYWPISRIGKIE
ncbi:MAG: signal peptidase I [Candidatus Omnitrophota bacterium]